MSFFQIPGNIKQSLLPFVIDPENNAINNTGVTSSTSVSGTPQLFSYRTTQNKIGKIGLFTRNIASDKSIIMKNMTKNQGIIFPPEENN